MITGKIHLMICVLVIFLAITVSTTTQCPVYQGPFTLPVDVEYQYSLNTSAIISVPIDMVID